MNEPAERAKTIRTAYQNYLLGRGGRHARHVAARLEPDEAGESTLAGMRGPYMQALDIANWSDTDWQTFAGEQGLHPNVLQAFHEEGFRRLYDFQERSVETILDGEDTVISAATGRGKTEAWLIPILDQIVKAKRTETSDARTSTKALLMYPTKALAQDQFKRLVQILYRINRHLRQKEWVTVGIYDGDTPRNIYEDKAQGYLNRTFDHFGCPGSNDDLEKCRSCGQGVFVERTTDDFKLRPDKPECETDPEHPVPLDFVRLTRNSIMDEGADIILTNPDTLNYRLLNVNAEREQETFVYDPEFLVFDEVHTYDGLLGSYTSTLVKRLRRLRDERGASPLQVIGSSATVANDESLFRQISGSSTVTPVREDPRELSPDDPRAVPDALLESRVSLDDVISSGRSHGTPPAQVGDIDLTVRNAADLDDDAIADRVSEYLFDHLTTDDPDDPVVRTYQALHEELQGDPRPPEAFRDDVSERFDLDEVAVDTLVDNFETVGQFSGLLESRHHLFSWPLDGFYTCADCSAVYRSPQESCSNCGGGFVTRATYCRDCSEEQLVANACPKCDQLSPYVHSEAGLIGHEEPNYCPRCLAATDDTVPMNRVVFRPTVECEDCGRRDQRSVTGVCEECGAPTQVRSDETAVCRNPTCEATGELTAACDVCRSHEQKAVRTDGVVTCPECGTGHEPTADSTVCCGSEVTNTRLVPWVCVNDTCDRRQFTVESPETCECGESDFVRDGLYEIVRDLECDNCGTPHLVGGDCGCDAPDPTPRSEPYRRYQAVTETGIRPAVDEQTAYPCDHGYRSTVVGDPFDELMRSPTNVSVTTTQYLLRDIADEESFDDTKLLGFSDSHREMKDLDRSFTEPEVDTLLDQLVMVGTELADSGLDPATFDTTELQQCRPGESSLVDDTGDGWVSLTAVEETALALVRALEIELAHEATEEPDLVELVADSAYGDAEAAFRQRVRERVISHGGYGEFTDPLAAVGLLDVRLPDEVFSGLSSDELTIVRTLADSGIERGVGDLPGGSLDGDIARTIDRLVEKEVVERTDRSRVRLNPSTLEVALPKDGQIDYDPFDDSYFTTLETRLSFGEQATACEDTLLGRADPDHPRYTERAYTATRSRLLVVISDLYFGQTPKMERRQIEHRFRDGQYPNFLSSGPTMELGVDIGSLDALLLNGAPPNMNAYLQRVGRAGRSSHSSLVHSVSHRNPIDYYYYDQPTELIGAQKQPVPLDEHNERVLEISLVWSVLDYVAATFTVPWNVTRSGVTGGEDFVHRSEATADARSDAGKFTHLLSKSVGELSLGADENRLRPLEQLIHDHEGELRSHLESIIEYAYCPNCHRHYDRDRAGEPCPGADCTERLVDAHSEFGGLVDDAIRTVVDVFVHGYRRYTEEIRARLAESQRRVSEIRTEFEQASGTERDRLSRELTRAEERVEVLTEYLEDATELSYFDFLGDAFSEYAFNLRSVSDTVGVGLVDETGEATRLEDGNGRSSRLALGELHPGAAYLHDRDPHVVSRVDIDDKGSTDLRETVEEHARNRPDSSLDGFIDEFVCPDCGRTTVETDEACQCDGSSCWTERRLVALDRVEAFHEEATLPNEQDDAAAVYDRPNRSVQNTFARRETEILEFDPTREFDLVTENGDPVGTLSLGSYTILEHASSFTAKYQSGEVDESETRFELCAEEDCDGIIYEDESGVDRCSVNPDHQPRLTETDSAYARLGYTFPTEGIRIELDDADQAHTLAHGVRIALQQLSGVNIRDIGEYVGASHVDVFDSEEGGAAVSRQLVRERAGEYPNFDAATEVIGNQLACDCAEGCPRCLYQYGCAERNRPSSFQRDPVVELFETEGLRLNPITD